ncbi:MAG: hypothetical protein J2P36_37455, partial [Ktedonobacteraceae bacterium]|nr:hypothetical protein [Ktedonobacteraceae bacterium]
MRQENGAELFGPDDPRSANVGMIHVSPSDDRQSIMTAILTQDKLGRRHTVLIMPDENAAFRRTTDFAYLRNLLQGLNTQLVIVASPNTPIARFAQRQQYPVFRSVENYASYARTFISEDQPPVTEEQEEPATPDSPQPAPAPSEQPEPVVVESDQMPTQPLDQRGQEAPWSTSLGEVEDDVPVPLRPLEARPLVVNEPASPGPLIAATDIALQEVPTGPTPQPRRRRTRLLLVSALLLALFLLIGGSVLSVFAGIGPLARLFPGSAASVTITAEKKLFKNVYAISAITWVPDPALHQVAAHFVSVNTPSQT